MNETVYFSLLYLHLMKLCQVVVKLFKKSNKPHVSRNSDDYRTPEGGF